MATAYEMLGISPMGWNGIPAVDPRKEEVAFECGKMVMELVRKGITPRLARHQEELRERHRGRHGDWRVHQRRAALARDRAGLRPQAVHR